MHLEFSTKYIINANKAKKYFHSSEQKLSHYHIYQMGSIFFGWTLATLTASITIFLKAQNVQNIFFPEWSNNPQVTEYIISVSAPIRTFEEAQYVKNTEDLFLFLNKDKNIFHIRRGYGKFLSW